MRKTRGWLGVALSVAALTVTVPAQAQVGSGDVSALPTPAPSPGSISATALAAAINERTSNVAQLEARQIAVERDLASAERRVAQLSSTLDGTAGQAAQLVASARRQALAAYVNADPATAGFALVASLGAGDVNEIAWSLGVWRAGQRQTLDLARRARELGGQADTALLAALQERDQLTGERSRLGPTIESARNDLRLAQLALENFVLQLGPSTIIGLTTTAFEAYRNAANVLAVEQPACGIRWELLAAIGKTESNHGSGRLGPTGDAMPPILGIPIGGDTDGGLIDTDPTQDHAVGPMQFIPSTWRLYATDANGDGIANPNNIHDEALAAARYLCRAAGALTLLTREGVVKAILSYNPNQEYLRVVGARFEALARDVANGWFSVANLPDPGPIDPGLGVGPGGVTGGGTNPDPNSTPSLPPPPTQILVPTIATDTGLVVGVAGDALPGSCLVPSAVLATRGFLTCVTQPPGLVSEVLDPCIVTVFDPTLAVCLPDPELPGRLVRLGAPAPAVAPLAGTPHLRLLLDGDDRCSPVYVPHATTPPTTLPPPPPGQGFVRTGRLPRQEDPTTTTTAPPDTTTTTAPPDTTTTTTTTAPPTTTTTTPTTTLPSSTTSTVPPPVTTVGPPTSTIPPPPGASYACASGAFVMGEPITVGATWTVTVTQQGIADRSVNVKAAYL
ncbi:MAG TPA: lytic murein transglycosylase [Acidimicrobiales bacterium]